MYKAYAPSGDCTMHGQAFLRQRGGGVVYAAGEDVILTPPVDYYFRMISRKYEVREVNYWFKKATRVTVADGNGNFAFYDVPCGEWIVRTKVFWYVGNSYQGRTLIEAVKLKRGDPRRFILN